MALFYFIGWVAEDAVNLSHFKVLFRKKDTPAVTGSAIKETRVKDEAKKIQG